MVNAANLSVSDGNLSLVGSSVINTGTLSTPNGNITLTAVPDSKTVRINQEGMILGLEIAPPNLESGISATDLPRLLTDPSLKDATGITIGANGELSLTGSNVSIDAAGNVTIAGSVSGNQVHLAAANDVNPIDNPESLIRTHNNQYSAPTVTRFAANSSDPNVHIFLDATVPDYTDLLFGGESGTTTTVVVPTENGIAKITDTLTTPGLSLVDELHIVSEGHEGNFWLGNAFVNGDNISQYQTAMQQWSQGLSVGADILLYACLTAAGSVGEALLNNIASYTEADVAGSTNLTGAGGDWILERSIGSIEADVPFEGSVLANYGHSLQLFTVNNGGDGGTLAAPDAGTLRDVIENTIPGDGANATPGADEIRFAPGITQVTLTLGQLNIDTTNGGLTIDGDANGAANNDNFAPLDLELSSIAGLMNARGGSTSSTLSNLASECGSNLAAAQGNQQLASVYLQSAIAEQIGTEYADLVQVRLVSSVQGVTAVIEVQPAPAPAFVTTEDGAIFYLYENGNVRDLDPAAVELYQQQRWPQ